MRNNSVKLQLSRRRCHFKIFLICSSGGPFCSDEGNHLSDFGREHQEEKFFEIILNLDRRRWR